MQRWSSQNASIVKKNLLSQRVLCSVLSRLLNNPLNDFSLDENMHRVMYIYSLDPFKRLEILHYTQV